jgi:hypothetical protein
MSEEPRDFLRRWSRMKRESAAASTKTNPEVKKNPEVKSLDVKPEAGTPAPLPSLDSLTFESDFKAFMHAKVEESVKRAALKKLFADPRFNVMDGLDTYIADYTQSDTIPADMFERMARKREKLFAAAAEKARAEADAAMPQGEAEETTPQAEASGQSEHHDGEHHDGEHHDGAHHDRASNDVDPAQDPKAL